MEHIVSKLLKELPTLAEGVVVGSSSSPTTPSASQSTSSTSAAACESTPSSSSRLAQRRRRAKEVRVCGSMYEQWPVLEFSDLNSSILELFTRGTSQVVSSALLYELTRADSDENGGSIRLNSEDQLKWCMQVLNHALTLSFATSREYESLKGAVRIYLHWLRALCDLPDNNIPTPLLETPEKYFRNIIDALRWIFCRRDEDSEMQPLSSTSSTNQVPKGLAIERQAIEIETVLDALRQLTRKASRKYQDEVWARTLSFMLNSADLLLAEPSATEEMGTRICSRVLDTLFELWLKAVLDEHIPSLTYWSSLAALTRRWRHNISLIECWAKKMLSFSVLVCRRMYGEDYIRIPVYDESVAPFGDVPTVDDEEDSEVHILYRTWYNLLCLLDSPAHILAHDAVKNQRLNGNAPLRTFSSISSAETSTAASNVSFFLAATALQRLVDIFYGDNRVSLDLMATGVEGSQPRLGNLSVAVHHDVHSHGTGRSATVATHEDVPASSATSSVSGRGAPPGEPPRRGQQSRTSDRSNGKPESASSAAQKASSDSQSRTTSEQTSSTATTTTTAVGSYRSAPAATLADGSSQSQAMSSTAASAPPNAAGNGAASVASPKSSALGDFSALTSSHTSATRFVANFLAANPVLVPHTAVNRSRPKSERMLALLGDWLFAAVLARHDVACRRNGDVTDDVISGLSLHSVDLEDVPEAMSPILGRGDANGHPPSNRRKSAGSSCSSVAGESEAGSTSQLRGHEGLPLAVTTVDGVTAGRAAALATLVRIVCSKSSQEKIPPSQLANFYATVFQALVEKDRLILCTLFYYGRNLFRLGLPGIEALLPHFLFALDIILIESYKLRLHPSISDVEMRRACLRTLSSVVCWPTTFGMSKIPQVPEGVGLKSSATTYLHLRARVYKTLVFSLRSETDAANLHIALALCTILMEESCAFDLGLNEEQTKELIRVTTATGAAGTPEKGLCASFVRGVVSAVCDRICRPEWATDHSISLAVIDVLNALSQVHHTVLFTNKDVSTGSLIVASLCRFIEHQLSKPPPLHSKDLHSTVVAAYNSIAVWLCAAPMLAECESVLNTISEAIQLGVTGSKKSSNEEARKAASQRVLEAAEYLMYSLFCVVGRRAALQCDEWRLCHQYGVTVVDPTRFVHVLVNGDTFLSLHEASHIPSLVGQSATVLYVRRSPIQGATAGIARLRSHPDGYRPDLVVPPTPMSAVSQYDGPMATPGPRPPPQKSIGEQFVIPPEFYKNTCKLDALTKNLDSTTETEAILEEMKRHANGESTFDRGRQRNLFEKLSLEQRRVAPAKPSETCNSIRVLLYDFGLVDEKVFGSDIVLLDSSQSNEFYRDMQELVDSCPARTTQTAHVFYVKEGQRTAVDILDNALNIQNTCGDFCAFLSLLGEGIEVGVHDTWTGHWSTAYSGERKPTKTAEPLDHYILDGVQNCLWWCDGGGCETAFLMPTERSVRMFKQNLSSPAASSRRGSNNKSASGFSDDRSFDSVHSDGLLHVARPKSDKSPSNLSERDFQPYSGGGSSMGGNQPVGRRGCELRLMIVWLERAEDMANFPSNELLCACDDGAESTGHAPKTSTVDAPAHHILFMHLVEPGIVQIRTRGTPNRFGEAGPLLDGTVVSLASLASFVRCTLQNIARRDVAEIDNYQFPHTKRKQAIVEMGKKYAANMTYEEFLLRLIRA